MGKCKDIFRKNAPRFHTVLTLHGRQAIQIRPCQQHQRRSLRERKGRKLHDNDVFHDAAATPISAKPNERNQQAGSQNGAAVNKANGRENDGDVQYCTSDRKDNADLNKEKGIHRQIKKNQCIQKGQKSQCIQEIKHNCENTASRWHAILKRFVLSSKRMRNIVRPIGKPGPNEMKRRQG